MKVSFASCSCFVTQKYNQSYGIQATEQVHGMVVTGSMEESSMKDGRIGHRAHWHDRYVPPYLDGKHSTTSMHSNSSISKQRV
eukprot:scaffold37743_cov211-Skeletonema_marinoi.AAC.4